MELFEKMKIELAKGTTAGKASQFVTFPDTGHAFHADYRPSFRQGPADEGWTRCMAWLKANGVA